MFELPGFDPKTLTDEQLLERSHEISGKIAFASRFSSNGGLDTLLKMSDAIDHERRERAYMSRWQRIEPILAAPIESDPDLRDAAIAQNAKPDDGIPRPRVRPRVSGMRRPTPSAAPVAASAREQDRPTATPAPTPTPPTITLPSPKPAEDTP